MGLQTGYRLIAMILVCLLAAIVPAGCSGQMTAKPPVSEGALAAAQSGASAGALGEATARAMRQAGIDAQFLGQGSCYVEIKIVGPADPEKQHVADAIDYQFKRLSPDIVQDVAGAQTTISCVISVARAEVEQGQILLWRREQAKGYVELNFSKTAGVKVVERQGLGTAICKRSWFRESGPKIEIE